MALEKISHIVGRGVYIPGDDIDTDRIIPARYLKCITFDELAEGLFADAKSSSKHPLNDARYEGASIMLSNSNFGCGSSREHAPQAIYRSGFRAVIAESFAEIFFGNSVTIGLPCVQASREDIEIMAGTIEQAPETEIAIDLDKQIINFADKVIPIQVDVSARNAFMEGKWDPIQELLDNSDAVEQRVNQLAYIQT